MRGLLHTFVLIPFIMCLTAGGAAASSNGPPAIMVFPDDPPLDVSFFFPAGGPLERFTGRPGAWYAVYRLPLHPGLPYNLVLEHSGDPGRIKLFALDDHPFERASVKSEIPLRRMETWAGSQRPTYITTIALPRDSAVYGIYLLVEWIPAAGEETPRPVSLLLLSADSRPRTERRSWRFPWADNGVRSPLQSLDRSPYEIPVPTRNTRDGEANAREQTGR